MAENFSKSRFFTPPAVDPLNLDLARLGGGGACPAQFWGETHDGKEVYVRYRGGYLSVTVADSPTVPASESDPNVLSVQLGPPLHGEISLGELCRYTGITINGSTPPLESAEGNADLSGAQTFYNIWQKSTFETQTRVLSDLLIERSDATLVQPIWQPGPGKYDRTMQGYSLCKSVEDLRSSNFFLLVGERLNDEAVRRCPPQKLQSRFPQHLLVAARADGFQYPVPKYSNCDAERVFKLLGKTIVLAGRTDDCRFGTLSLHAHFQTDDEAARVWLERFDAHLNGYYPTYCVSHFDLLTGKAESDLYFKQMDPEIVRWVNAAPDRWLSMSDRGTRGHPRFVGGRATLRA